MIMQTLCAALRHRQRTAAALLPACRCLAHSWAETQDAWLSKASKELKGAAPAPKTTPEVRSRHAARSYEDIADDDEHAWRLVMLVAQGLLQQCPI